MDENMRKEILRKITESITMEVSMVEDMNTTMNWYPILPAKTAGFVLGINEDGVWVLESNSVLRIINTQKKFWITVALLEQPADEVREELEKQLSFLNFDGVNIDLDSFFPFLEIARAGLQFESDYWATLAFSWYDEFPFEKKISLIDTLTSIKNAKWASQKLRHRAMRELKALEREENQWKTREAEQHHAKAK